MHVAQVKQIHSRVRSKIETLHALKPKLFIIFAIITQIMCLQSNGTYVGILTLGGIDYDSPA